MSGLDRLRAEVLSDLSDLPETEQRVALEALREVVAGLALGLARYGALDLSTDRRDWDDEGDQEARDLLTYRMIRRVALRGPR